MKHLSHILAIALATCFAGSVDAVGKKLRKEADFQAQVVGKTLVYDDGAEIVVGDGTLSGKTANGGNIVGAWSWQGRFFCRNLQVGTNRLPTDCQVVEIDGEQISFIREKGRGDRSTATLR